MKRAILYVLAALVITGLVTYLSWKPEYNYPEGDAIKVEVFSTNKIEVVCQKAHWVIAKGISPFSIISGVEIIKSNPVEIFDTEHYGEGGLPCGLWKVSTANSNSITIKILDPEAQDYIKITPTPFEKIFWPVFVLIITLLIEWFISLVT